MTNETKKARTTSNARKANAKTIVRDAPTILLKTLHDDIMKNNANATITTKKMRVMLRKSYAHIHAHNNAWIFNQNEYDEIRSIYDAKYRASIERKAKTTTRVAKAKTKTRAIDTNVDVADVQSNASTPNTIDA